jgi:hypothetical protein
MSSWARSTYRTASATASASVKAPAEGGRVFPTDNQISSTTTTSQDSTWQTVGTPRSARTWGSSGDGNGSRWGSSASTFHNSGGGGDMPSAFTKKPRDGGDRPPRRITDEEARRDYMMKLAAEKARADAEQAKQIADTEDNFPSLGASSANKRPSASQQPPAPKKSWSAHIITANDENEQKLLADEKADKEAQDKLADGMTVLRLYRKEMREPFFTTGEIETEKDFFRNERLRAECFSSSIIAEQEKYDYNREISYREDDFDEEPSAAAGAGRAYSPHSPKFPHSFDDEEAPEDEE